LGIEIEAKMRLTDFEAVQSRLEALDGESQGAIFETNTFFDDSEGRLKSADRGLRIRVEQGEGQAPVVSITHKGPRTQGQLKSRSESEVRVDDAHRAAELLEELGYHPVLTFEKRRQRWLLDGCRVELDTLPYLGTFIEIEGPSDEAVFQVREKLGMDQAPMVRNSYVAMLQTYIRENDLRTSLIRFDSDNGDAASGAATSASAV